MSNEVRITPSILNADFAHLDSEIAKISQVSDLIHLDIMDNVFVPKMTFDFQAASEIIKNCPIPVDSHLMVADVDNIAVQYAEAGSASVTIHVEATTDIRNTLKEIKSHGARASIALKPNTDIQEYSEYFDLIDMVLIMTVEPGFGGQGFMHEMMSKVRRTRELIGDDKDIALQVDGGISIDTIAQAAEAGADTFVAGSAIFKASDPDEMVRTLREKVLENRIR
jgi:ribulose-phosphate 3-epimerase